MKNKIIFLSVVFVVFVVFIGIATYVYAQMGSRGAMMGNMMNESGSYSHENYTNKSYTGTKLSSENKKGMELYESLCAQCHGKDAQGEIGPNIQGMSAKNINWALKNVSMMSFLRSKNQLKSQNNIRYIAGFLQSINAGK